jgi:hypothetical protein
MPRPRKPEDQKRSKWPVLNVTLEERCAIERYAIAAGQGVSAYIIARALQKPVSPRQDWTRIVRQQSELLALLQEIALQLLTATPVTDAGAALLALRRIETRLAAQSAQSTPEGAEDTC